MNPFKAIKLENVTLVVKPYPEEELLPADGLYRHLYEPGELEGGQQRRATDTGWPPKFHFHFPGIFQVFPGGFSNFPGIFISQIKK
jgi:hypothetical protein